MMLTAQQLPRRYLQILIFMLMLIGLHACGFQLRGSINLSSEMAPIYIEQNSVFDLARELRTLLASNEIKVVENSGQSKSQLRLINEVKSRRVLSVDGSGRAREYLLTYTVNFVIRTRAQELSELESLRLESIKNKDNGAAVSQNSNARKPIPQDSISVTRTWLFDPDAVLAVTNEAELLYKEMRREAARFILLKINARSKSEIKKGDDSTRTPANNKAAI